MRVGGQGHALVALPPGQNLGTYFTEGWVDPRSGLTVVEKRKYKFVEI